MLIELEHGLPGRLCEAREPLHAFYVDATRELEVVTIEEFIAELLYLLKLGYAGAYFFDEELRRSQPPPDPTEADLRKHCARRTSAQLRQRPPASKGGEYFLGITEAGRAKEASEAYARYYADLAAAGQP